jgi:hypothetical protein
MHKHSDTGVVMKGKREQDESGPKDITLADTIGPVSTKHVMKKFGAFVTSLVAAFIVYVVHGMVITGFVRDVRDFRNIGMSLLLIDAILIVGLMIAAALLTYRALNKKIK